jgi:cysteine dioxygenase
MSESASPTWFSVEELMLELRALPAQAFTDVTYLQRYLALHRVEPATLEPYLRWDAQHYTRNLIDKTELFELIALCWEVGQASCIHNHHQQNCWMTVAIGNLMIQNYRTVFEDIYAGRCEIHPTHQVLLSAAAPQAVDPEEPVHKVYNPREFGLRAVSLHIYSRPFDTCVVYSEEGRTCQEIRMSYTNRISGGPSGTRIGS